MSATAADPADKAFFGHPKALGYLAFTEAWERFSFYGMQTLLVLYMSQYLLLPENASKVVGFQQFSAFLQRLNGIEATPIALASATFGLYGGLVYLTPMLGGFIADQVGKTRTIITGALLMAAGHFLMAFEATFLLALLALVLGSGCFKGNIAGQVGSLYADKDLRRADAFQIFYLAINAGVLAAPIVTGTLAQKVAWHYGFGAAGVGMLVAIGIYLWGRRHLPPDPPLGRAHRAERPRMTARDWRTTAVLVLLLPVLTATVLGNMQIFNAYLLWADTNVDFTIFGQQLPSSWLVSLDTVASVSFLAGMVIFWRVWATRFPEPDELGKITIGAFLSVTGLLALAAAAAISEATGEKVSLWWCVLFHVLNSIALANVLPVSLALYSRAAPAALGATIIGVYYLHLAGANMIVGRLGALLESMSGSQFWLMHSAIAVGAGVVFLLVGRFFAGMLRHDDTGEAATAQPA